MKDIKKDILWRVYLVYLGILFFGIIIIGKVVYIQFYEGNALIKKARQQELKYFNIEAVRGNICASDGSLLATSVPVFEIRMDVGSNLISDEFFNEKVDSLAYCLSKLFKNKSKKEYLSDLKNARKKGNRYFRLKRKVKYEQLKELRTFPILRLGKYRGGLIVIPKTIRKMPFKELAKRTIGYENKKENLFVGLEGAYSEYLEGKKGKQLRQRICNGDWKPIQDENEIEPQNGKDIITTIDINIQDVAGNALLEHLKEHKAFQGCAILMEVETGYIKAIANLQYDSSDNKYKESYNYAFAENVEPGSTFKLASMIAVIEDKKVNLSDTIDTGDGWIVYYNRTMRDAHKIRDGKITCREAFEKSSNVGVSMIIWDAYKKNPEKFVEHLYDMSLNKPLGIEFQGEGHPFIKHPKDKKIWYGTTLPWMSVGYEISLTPLQILTFYNAVANGGKMVKPMFVKEIRQTGKTIKTFKPVVINKSICSKRTIDTVQSLLEGVVERGTAKSLNNSIYKIAGKTGTAQIANKNKGYSKGFYNASFVGYFPADDPKYSCIVVVNKPSGGKYYGSSVAAPVFKEIADKVYATQLDIHQQNEEEQGEIYIPLVAAGNQSDLQKFYQTFDFPIDTLSSTAEWVVTSRNNNSVKFGKRRIKPEIVPNVYGMSAKDAIYILENLGMRTKLRGKGIVKNQSVKAGSKVRKGTEITLNLSTI